MMKLVIPALVILLSATACKTTTPASEVSNEDSKKSWLTLDQHRAKERDSQKVYVFKFGAKWCGPCVILTRELPQLASSVSTERFEFVDIDVETTPNAQNAMITWFNQNPKLRDDLRYSRGSFQNGITIPWVIMVDSQYNPIVFLPGFDTSSTKVEEEKARYKSALENALKRVGSQ